MAQPNQSVVGFGFQADIVNTGSLTHFLTGKILKALSDARVDIYAIAASIWLGKQVPVRSALEVTVHPALASRTGIQGFLAKALSIGWGHSDVAIEMARTKAGTNALLLIGAVSSGSHHFTAAQTLSELLVVFGCEADQIPNVDVLKTLIAYLAPFVQDLGFSKVLHHVTVSAQHAVMRQPDHIVGHDSDPIPLGLTAVGDAPVVAATIKQLVLTSQRREKIYFNAYQRAAWLAAFSSHILGMSVELLFHGTVLWASAGVNGSVVFQISHKLPRGTSALRRAASTQDIVLIDQPCTEDGNKPLALDSAPAEAIDAALGKYPLIDANLRCAVLRGISELSSQLLSSLKMVCINSDGSFIDNHINGLFNSRDALEETLSHFGIMPDTNSNLPLRFADQTRLGWMVSPGNAAAMNGLSSLDVQEAERLRNACPLHGTEDGKVEWRALCICFRVGNIIHGFAASIVALMQCRYDPNELRLSSGLLCGDIDSSWAQHCVLIEDLHRDPHGSSYRPTARQDSLLRHMSLLLHGNDSDALKEASSIEIEEDISVLGISGASTTIYYTCIMSEDCYDPEGRMLTISSGRASINGIMRHSICDRSLFNKWTYNPLRVLDNRQLARQKAAKMAPGSYVEPHYRSGDLKIFMHAALTERHIQIHTAIGYSVDQTKEIPLLDCINRFFGVLTHHSSCDHRLDDPWYPPSGVDVYMSSFGFPRYPQSEQSSLVLFALKGRKFEQLVQCRLHHCSVLQLHICLNCAADLVQLEPKRANTILMA